MRLIRLRDGDVVAWFRPDDEPWPPRWRPRERDPFRDFVHVSLAGGSPGRPEDGWPESGLDQLDRR